MQNFWNCQIGNFLDFQNFKFFKFSKQFFFIFPNRRFLHVLWNFPSWKFLLDLLKLLQLFEHSKYMIILSKLSFFKNLLLFEIVKCGTLVHFPNSRVFEFSKMKNRRIPRILQFGKSKNFQNWGTPCNNHQRRSKHRPSLF